MTTAMTHAKVSTEERSRRANAARKHKNRAKGKGHPTTAEMDYSEEEIEFMFAVQAFKDRSGRHFPTLSEMLNVIRGLGYSKDIPGQAFDMQ